MNVLDMTIIRLAAGLVLLIATNIALGSINAIILRIIARWNGDLCFQALCV